MDKSLLLLFLLIFSHSTDSKSGSIVKFLPGFEGPLPFELETGYIGIGEEEEVQLFYYFMKSERNPEKDPLVIWISGGPGCSSFNALLFDNGPLGFKTEGYNGGRPTLVSTTYSWTKVASILFLDQPVGAGFSYATNHVLGRLSDTGEGKRIPEFIRKWLSQHQEYISNPFYVGGDSYSENDLGLKPQINLQGYVLGNPITDFDDERNSRIPYTHGMGLISDELYESLKGACRGNYEHVDPSNTVCLNFVKDFRKCTKKINNVQILRPICDVELPTILSPNDSPKRYFRGLLDEYFPVPSPSCIMYLDLLPTQWANDESVRKALNVVKGSVGEWKRCVWDLPYDQDITNAAPYHMNNSIKGYRSLIYSGDHDLTEPFISTQAWIRSLNYSVIDDWRPWMINDHVGGYTRTYANKMTFATIKGGGHTAKFKPDETFIMFQRWISGQPL